jgi:hypothetical protein
LPEVNGTAKNLPSLLRDTKPNLTTFRSITAIVSFLTQAQILRAEIKGKAVLVINKSSRLHKTLGNFGVDSQLVAARVELSSIGLEELVHKDRE